jgi:hypothetical protein
LIPTYIYQKGEILNLLIDSNMTTTSRTIIPVYTSRGDAEAFLVNSYLYNRMGEWIGWVTPEQEVYSVLGYYVGYFSKEPRILRQGAFNPPKQKRIPPPAPLTIYPPATVPLAPMMSELLTGTVDVLLEEPERLHTCDSGEFRKDLE